MRAAGQLTTARFGFGLGESRAAETRWRWAKAPLYSLTARDRASSLADALAAADRGQEVDLASLAEGL